MNNDNLPTKKIEVTWHSLPKDKVEQLPNDKNGVYIFVDPIVNEFWCSIYVGKEKPFLERYRNHIDKDKEANPELFDFLVNEDWIIFYAEVGLNDYEGVEEYLFQQYEPELILMSLL